MPSTVIRQIGGFVGGVTLTVLLLLLGHWFPWVRKLTRIEAYAYGTASLWFGLAVWRFIEQDWITPTGFAVMILIAGAAVKGAYLIDIAVLRIRQAEKAERNDRDLQAE
jgi:hypothetical protein